MSKTQRIQPPTDGGTHAAQPLAVNLTRHVEMVSQNDAGRAAVALGIDGDEQRRAHRD
ncbi:MAG: hypothetical protein M3R15_19350 [Acidobacteriota bacterium]|nr:hypothetical protein [Acidobacteriota bacterium]